MYYGLHLQRRDENLGRFPVQAPFPFKQKNLNSSLNLVSSLQMKTVYKSDETFMKKTLI